MEIRFATLKDFNQVRLFDPHSKYIDPEKIRQKLKNEEIIIATINSEIIGIIKFSYFWATRPFLDLIWIKENQRNKGIGKELLNYLENYLTSEKHNYLFSSAEEKDKEAILWHKKNDFIETGKVKCLNLPHDKTPEIFFYKRISKRPENEDSLTTYNL